MRLTSQLSAFRSRHNGGKILVSLALVAFTLMAFAGLAIDMGRMEFYRRRIQAAADSGAVGGARELQVNGSTNLVTAAKDDITTNGYTNGVNSASVTVSYPPVSGPRTGDSRYLEVVVSRPYPTTFFRALRVNTMNLKARAVGGMGPSDYCIIALNPTLSGALTVAGSSTVNSPGCAVMDDSNNVGSALNYNGGGCLAAKSINIVGGYSASNCSTFQVPKTGATYVYDPLAYLSPPTFGGCDYTNVNANTTTTLNPGVYCGGIKVTSGGTITLNPGIYILNGGGFSASGSGVVQGTGVMFYNTGTSSSGINKYDDFHFNGSQTFHLSAPTSGTYEGILYFQNRSIVGSSSGDVINGTSSSYFDGVFYAAAGKVDYTGTSSATGYTSIVADTIKFSGNSTLKNDYSSLPRGNPIRNGALME
jgi:hypothetical protein